MKRIYSLIVVLSLLLGVSAQAHATLFLRGTDPLGNQLIYDDDLNITWYDYQHPFDIYDRQMVWAADLVVDFGGTVYDDWRLPTALNPDGTGPCGGDPCYDSTGSEMGHLYYTELGNSAGGPLSTSFTDGLTGYSASFQNLQPYPYWSGTLYAPDPDYAWGFNFYDGYQPVGIKEGLLYALAVRPGDVTVVPEPGTMLLLGSGLVGLAALRRKIRS